MVITLLHNLLALSLDLLITPLLALNSSDNLSEFAAFDAQLTHGYLFFQEKLTYPWEWFELLYVFEDSLDPAIVVLFAGGKSVGVAL